jgi:uncharacterized damage-inducible protein DinB
MSTTAPAEPKTSVEFAAGVREFLLQAVESEIAKTANVIKAVPDAKAGWKPDEKSRSAGDLAWHIASEDVIFLEQIAEGKFQFPDPRFEKERPKTSAEMAQWYERKIKAAIAKVRALSPEKIAEAREFFGMNFPAFAYILFMNNHSIHHRGQLAAYLRPCGSKVPDIYGGSADTPMGQ